MLRWLTGVFLLVANCIAVGAQEFRGLWVDTYHPGIRSAAEIDRLVADARAGNFNALIVQVRRRGDAFYESQFEPKAFDVTPQSFDPLADLIAKAHDTSSGPRLDVHAWIVTYPIFERRNGTPRQANHPYALHPDWLTQSIDGESWSSVGYAFDPGHPEVQNHVYNVAMDILSNYDVDGLNLDYVRYDGLGWGYNPVAVERFNEAFARAGVPSPSNPEWMQWRRDQVTALVRRIYLGAAEIRPLATISADTICFAPGVTTVAGWTRASNAFTSVLQDWRGWLEEGILDLNLPMAYFDAEGNHTESWLNWNTFIKDHRYGRHAAVGLGAYLNSITNTLQQIHNVRAVTTAGNSANGISVYSYNAPAIDETVRFVQLSTALTQTGNTIEALFAEPADVPTMAWKVNPTVGHLKGTLAIVGSAYPRADDQVRVDGPDGRRFVSPDLNGHFGLANVTPGRYRMIAARDGYMPFMTNLTVAAGEVIHTDMQLVPLPPETAPVVALQPEDDTGEFGHAVTLQSIGAASTPVAYQWHFRDAPVPGATNSLLSFDAVDFAAAGWYSLVMSNDFGAVTSEVAQITVTVPEAIYDVRASAGQNSAIITWRSPEPGNATVEFGLSSNRTHLATLPWTTLTNHAIRLSGLAPATVYSFVVETDGVSRDFTSEAFTVRTAGEIVIDNPEARFTGGWTTGDTAAGRYGEDYRFAGTSRFDATSTATYRPDLPAPGRYDIDIWHPHGSNRSERTPHVITFDGGSLTNSIDQTRNGGQWQELAADLPLRPDNNSGVRISNVTGEPAKVVIADAIRFDYLPEQDVAVDASLPMWWLSHFSGKPVEPDEDLDADGYSNREEYLIGSHPLEAGSSMHVQSYFDADGLLQILFLPMHPDRQYYLEFAMGWGNGEWRRFPNLPGFRTFVTPDSRGGFVVPLPDDLQIVLRVVAEVPVFGPREESEMLPLELF